MKTADKLVGLGLGAALTALSATQAFAMCRLDVKEVISNGGGNITIVFSADVYDNNSQYVGSMPDYTKDYTGYSDYDIALTKELRGGLPEASGSSYSTSFSLRVQKKEACDRAYSKLEGPLVRP